MTIKGGTNKACAACKYQRRRCSKECPLSPYFPADQPKKFSNAHRLFGVCNIMKILNQVEPDQKDDAMESIIYESNMRAKYPVLGCVAVVKNLQIQISKAMEELCYSKMLLAFCEENSQYHHLPYQMPFSPNKCPLLSQQLQFGLPPNNVALPIYDPLQHNNNGELSLFDGVNYGNYYNGSAYMESEDHNLMMKPSLGAQQGYCNGIVTNVTNNAAQPNLMAMQQGISHQLEFDIPADYDDMPFDAQSLVECEEACESSAESPFKDSNEHIGNVSKDELKSAAACFSLTSAHG